MSKHVVVVGAGPGGLAAAMLLSKAGLAVTVVERLPHVGGRSATLRLGDGFRFDTGATFFLYPRVLEDIFTACGRRLDEAVDLIRLDPQYDIVFEGAGKLRATPDPAAMAAEIGRFAPRDVGGFERFMADNRRKLELFRPVLEAPFNGARDLVSPAMLRALPQLRPHSSVDGDLRRYFSDPRMRLAFSFQSKYLGMSPYQCPSLFTILAFMEYEYGVFHPRGGCGAVLESMAAAARDLGADIRLGEPVEEILFEGQRAVGVRTSEGTLACDALVLNADFAHSMTRLVPEALRRRRWSDRAIDAKRYSCSTFMLYLGVKGAIDEIGHHTIFLAEDYRRNLDEIEEGLAPGDPSFYVHNPCVTEPGLAPPGHSTLYMLIPVGHQQGRVDWPRLQAEYRSLAFRQLAKLGLHDIEKRIVVEKVMTPATWASDLAIHRGATFNLAHNIGQMLHWRPRNRFADLDGVYLVGGGTHPGSGLPVIFESARISSRLLVEDLGLAPNWHTQSRMAPAFETALAG